MKFYPTDVSGAYVVDIEPHADDRGFFARTFCAETFSAHGLAAVYPHCNVSYNAKRGTLRGMHFQASPKREAKLIRVTRGAVYDVALDLRPDSPTYLKWAAVELTAEKRNAFYIPQGCAHGFLTLADDCEIFYQMSEVYAADLSGGVRYDDPAFAICWPFAPAVISERDASFPVYRRTPPPA